jgi:hypothetical protein
MQHIGVFFTLFFAGAHAQGTTAKTLNDVLTQLKAAEVSVQKLWNQSTQLTANVTKLERDTVKTMANETNTSTHLMQLEFATSWNNRTLGHYVYWTSQYKEALDFERYDLSTADKAKKDTGTAAKTLAKKANDTVTKANLTALEEISQKLWQVSNPQAPASLDKTEKRLTDMDTQIEKLRGSLDTIIKNTMKKKMRRNMDRWRNDNIQLGEIALHASGDAKKYFLKDDIDADGRWTTLPEDDDGPEFSRSDQWFLQVGASEKVQTPPPGFLSTVGGSSEFAQH